MRSLLTSLCILLVCTTATPAPPTSSAPTHEAVSQETSWLFVQNATSGSFAKGRLSLETAVPVVFFSDRPYRVAGHVTPKRLVEAWSVGDNSFASDPPNATLSLLGEGVESYVVELSNPKFDGKTFSYQVKVLDGEIPAKFGQASLFIDNNLWAAVGGLAAGRAITRRRDAAFVAGQASAQTQQAATYQSPDVTYHAQPSSPCPPAQGK